MSTDVSPKKPSDLAIRSVVGIGMVAVAITALWFGDKVFWALCAVAGLFMMAEWADLDGVPAKTKLLAQYAITIPLALMAPGWAAGAGFLTLGATIGAAFFLVIVTRRPTLAAGALYVGLPILSLLLIRRQEEGIVFTLWALALVWMCDIGAYFSGRAIGGPKLAPAFSPNKTWAGLAGGVVLASAFGALMHVQYGLPWRLTLATPVLAIVAQGGDLFESWLKRRAGVKDSGNILPGHGGILDRLDGLVPVAPIAALLVILPKFYPW
ncbi:MAG: phosphatidate cytidylyltransferase [Sphingomonas bacterium]|uniref:phosphatidate cytidylyltransferase n=1 Tax=Sphingomonas bacterium TaxID=1895847 RepID=UPI00260C271B|nr:phosphatidate cytidylyltransferase [Sphingomonas bacterium]MDB5706682.1 phosphatidate cytidylyltransferase [Sphingomonas bacterium]